MENQSIQALKKQMEQMQQRHKQELKRVEFEYLLALQIYKYKGRNQKAICALLELKHLQQSQNPEQEIALALEKLQRETPYLFELDRLPLYAGGTATQPPKEKSWNGLRVAFGLPV